MRLALEDWISVIREAELGDCLAVLSDAECRDQLCGMLQELKRRRGAVVLGTIEGYYVRTETGQLELHATAETARDALEARLQQLREASGYDTWPEDTERMLWGELQKQAGIEPRYYDPAWLDYELVPAGPAASGPVDEAYQFVVVSSDFGGPVRKG